MNSWELQLLEGSILSSNAVNNIAYFSILLKEVVRHHAGRQLHFSNILIGRDALLKVI